MDYEKDSALYIGLRSVCNLVWCDCPSKHRKLHHGDPHGAEWELGGVMNTDAPSAAKKLSGVPNLSVQPQSGTGGHPEH